MKEGTWSRNTLKRKYEVVMHERGDMEQEYIKGEIWSRNILSGKYRTRIH